eukprot:1420939-Prymnesium_polylepis.1
MQSTPRRSSEPFTCARTDSLESEECGLTPSVTLVWMENRARSSGLARKMFPSVRSVCVF